MLQFLPTATNKDDELRDRRNPAGIMAGRVIQHLGEIWGRENSAQVANEPGGQRFGSDENDSP